MQQITMCCVNFNYIETGFNRILRSLRKICY